MQNVYNVVQDVIKTERIRHMQKCRMSSYTASCPQILGAKLRVLLLFRVKARKDVDRFRDPDVEAYNVRIGPGAYYTAVI